MGLNNNVHGFEFGIVDIPIHNVTVEAVLIGANGGDGSSDFDVGVVGELINQVNKCYMSFLLSLSLSFSLRPR